MKTLENDKYNVQISHFRKDDPKGIIIVFPGAGYSCMGPCLYYPSGALYEKGYELLNIEYDFRKERLKDNSRDTYRDFLKFLLSEIFKLNLPHNKVALCKSIGTRIFTSEISKEFSKAILLTPCLTDDFVFEEMKLLEDKCLFVIGDRDPFYIEDRVTELQQNGLPALIIKDADHGLDIDYDLNRSLDEMKRIISTVEDFVES